MNKSNEPKKNFWFKHDFDARNDLKLVQLRMDVGPVSDGIFWNVIEMMYKEGGQMSLSTIPCIAKLLNTSEELVNKVVCKSGMFVVETDIFYSKQVRERLHKMADEKAAKSA